MTYVNSITQSPEPEPVIGTLWEHYAPGRRITRVTCSHEGYAVVVTGDEDVEVAFRWINGETVWEARGSDLPPGVEDHATGVAWARRFVGGAA